MQTKQPLAILSLLITAISCQPFGPSAERHSSRDRRPHPRVFPSGFPTGLPTGVLSGLPGPFEGNRTGEFKAAAGPTRALHLGRPTATMPRSTPTVSLLLPGRGSGTNGSTPGSDGGGSASLPAGFATIIFQDDFSSQPAGSLPDAAKWTIDTGTGYPGGPANWGTQEIQTYTSSGDNLAITPSGTLRITPIRSGDSWTSARMETTAAHDFACAAGKKIRMEASIRLANADAATQSGIWPAFWSLGAAYRTNLTSWPEVGEIDVLEVSNGASTVHHTAHCGVIGGGPCNEKKGLSSSVAFPRGCFVRVAAEVDRTGTTGGDFAGERLAWYVDGRQTKVLTGAEVGDAAAWESLARTPKMLLLNVAVGGEFPDAFFGSGKTPNARSVGGEPSAMEVAYVAIYST